MAQIIESFVAKGNYGATLATIVIRPDDFGAGYTVTTYRAGYNIETRIAEDKGEAERIALKARDAIVAEEGR